MLRALAEWTNADYSSFLHTSLTRAVSPCTKTCMKRVNSAKMTTNTFANVVWLHFSFVYFLPQERAESWLFWTSVDTFTLDIHRWYPRKKNYKVRNQNQESCPKRNMYTRNPLDSTADRPWKQRTKTDRQTDRRAHARVLPQCGSQNPTLILVLKGFWSQTVQVHMAFISKSYVGKRRQTVYTSDWATWTDHCFGSVIGHISESHISMSSVLDSGGS